MVNYNVESHTEKCYVLYFWHPMLVRPDMKRLFCLKAKKGHGRFAPSALPHYNIFVVAFALLLWSLFCLVFLFISALSIFHDLIRTSSIHCVQSLCAPGYVRTNGARITTLIYSVQSIGHKRGTHRRNKNTTLAATKLLRGVGTMILPTPDPTRA